VPNSVLDFLLDRARVPVPPTSLELRIAGRACGWVAADVPALLTDLSADFVLDPTTLHFLPSQAQLVQALGWPTATVSALMERVAKALYAAGRLNGWRNELLDVVDDKGQVCGVIERAAVRPLGIATHAVHLDAWTPEGELWIAQRALTKNTDPGMWDTLVGGLISAGETPEFALERESWEEAGLPASALATGHRVGQFRVERVLPEGYQVEIVTVVDCVLDSGIQPENQDGEVVAIRAASVQEVLSMLADGAFTLEASLSLLLSLDARGIQTGVARNALRRLALPR
jgi:8-oxo-dGTP pyrophosphatase MutT (NUDIX family)